MLPNLPAAYSRQRGFDEPNDVGFVKGCAKRPAAAKFEEVNRPRTQTMNDAAQNKISTAGTKEVLSILIEENKLPLDGDFLSGLQNSDGLFIEDESLIHDYKRLCCTTRWGFPA